MSLRKPTARVMGMQFRDADAYGATVVFDVQIVNHYPVELPLMRFNYAVSSRGKRFMAGSSELAVQIPVGGSQTVSLPARIDYISTLRRLGGVRPGATIPYEAQVDLTIDTPRLGSDRAAAGARRRGHAAGAVGRRRGQAPQRQGP